MWNKMLSKLWPYNKNAEISLYEPNKFVLFYRLRNQRRGGSDFTLEHSNWFLLSNIAKELCVCVKRAVPVWLFQCKCAFAVHRGNETYLHLTHAARFSSSPELAASREHIAQQAHDVEMTSYLRRCGGTTSKWRHTDVDATSSVRRHVPGRRTGKFHIQLLLWNHWANCNEIMRQGLRSHKQLGRHAYTW